MDDTSLDTADPMEGMDNIPVLLGFNGSRSYARSIALIILVAGFLALNGASYARFVIMDQPFVFLTGWKTLLGYLGVCALFVFFCWSIPRQSIDIFPGSLVWSGMGTGSVTFDRINRIDVVRDLCGRVHLVALKVEGAKVWSLIGGFDGMDALCDSLVDAVKGANPRVSVCHKTRPHLITTGTCCLVALLLGCYYLWIAVQLPSHVAPLLPLLPAFLLLCAQVAVMAVFQWSLAGYRMAFAFLMVPAQLVMFQISILLNALITHQSLGGGCGC